MQPDETRPGPDGSEDRAPRRRIELNWVQVVAAVAAAVSAAVAASALGVAGTIVGTAVVSIVATVGNALYTASLKRTREKLKDAQIKVLRRTGATRDAAGDARAALGSVRAALGESGPVIATATVRIPSQPGRSATGAAQVPGVATYAGHGSADPTPVPAVDPWAETAASHGSAASHGTAARSGAVADPDRATGATPASDGDAAAAATHRLASGATPTDPDATRPVAGGATPSDPDATRPVAADATPTGPEATRPVTARVPSTDPGATRPVAAGGAPDGTVRRAAPTDPAAPGTVYGGATRRKVPRRALVLAGSAAVVFALAFGVLTGIEALMGTSFSALWGHGDSGSTAGALFDGHGGTRRQGTDASSPTPRGSTAGSGSPEPSGSVAPSGTPSGRPSHAPSPSGAGGTPTHSAAPTPSDPPGSEEPTPQPSVTPSG